MATLFTVWPADPRVRYSDLVTEHWNLIDALAAKAEVEWDEPEMAFEIDIVDADPPEETR